MPIRTPASVPTTILYRPVGVEELRLVAASGWRRFPPRLAHQPIFYPVLVRSYAEDIARDWNTVDEASGFAGFVTRFAVERARTERYPVQVVGARDVARELWVPAAELEAFNDRIVGPIEVVSAFRGAAYDGAAEGVLGGRRRPRSG